MAASSGVEPWPRGAARPKGGSPSHTRRLKGGGATSVTLAWDSCPHPCSRWRLWPGSAGGPGALCSSAGSGAFSALESRSSRPSVPLPRGLGTQCLEQLFHLHIRPFLGALTVGHKISTGVTGRLAGGAPRASVLEVCLLCLLLLPRCRIRICGLVLKTGTAAEALVPARP